MVLPSAYPACKLRRPKIHVSPKSTHRRLHLVMSVAEPKALRMPVFLEKPSRMLANDFPCKVFSRIPNTRHHQSSTAIMLATCPLDASHKSRLLTMAKLLELLNPFHAAAAMHRPAQEAMRTRLPELWSSTFLPQVAASRAQMHATDVQLRASKLFRKSLQIVITEDDA